MNKIKRVISLVMIGAIMLSATACTNADYKDAESFEEALNDGEDVEGKTVRFEVDEVRENALGYYVIWAGDHLNFVSSDEPDVKEGEKITVEITEAQKVLGSWLISYEVEN